MIFRLLALMSVVVVCLLPVWLFFEMNKPFRPEGIVGTSSRVIEIPRIVEPLLALYLPKPVARLFDAETVFSREAVLRLLLRA